MSVWKPRMCAAASAVAAVLFLVATPLPAQEAASPNSSGEAAGSSRADGSAAPQEPGRSGYWELGAFIGLLNDEPEYHPDVSEDQFRRDALIGARGGYTLPFGLFLQAQGSNSLVRIATPNGNGVTSTRNTNIFFVESVLGYNFDISARFDAFLGGGVGAAISTPDDMPSETDLALNYGVGGRYKFADSRLAVRGDVRMHQVLDAMQDFRGLAGVPASDRDVFALELSVGVSVFLGR
jgi:hypothetical protein